MAYKSVYEAIEEQLKVKLGGITYIKTVSTWGDEDFEEALGRLVARVPSALIVWGGDTIEDAGVKGSQGVKYNYSIILCDRSLRGDEETRHGYSEENPGLYKMIQDVKTALRSEVLMDEKDKPLGQIIIEDVNNLGRTDDGYSVGVVEISIWNEEVF